MIIRSGAIKKDAVITGMSEVGTKGGAEGVRPLQIFDSYVTNRPHPPIFRPYGILESSKPIRERQLMTSDFRVGRGVQNDPQKSDVAG